MIEAMRISVASEQKALEKKEARRPHSGRSTKPRQDVFTNKRLDEEQQERTPENRDRKG